MGRLSLVAPANIALKLGLLFLLLLDHSIQHVPDGDDAQQMLLRPLDDWHVANAFLCTGQARMNIQRILRRR